ncbi:hypothetical protein Pla163_10080 [Planctomycetes bacterium Pla163]|uniref:VWFA domain-containing protein n=1 Tax=Rohdeia mirabilis TaxID=2528008 RepID=A0A518CXH9_9BACT|nr:hypothetical protein Pla163_10080 [Planctomycetes bacterium Pla163]
MLQTSFAALALLGSLVAAPSTTPADARTAEQPRAVLAPEPAPASSATQEVDEFAKAKARYEEYLRRLPLLMHTRGREALAATRDMRALEILAQSYASPVAPKEQVRYLIAAICFRAFKGHDHVDRWIQWRLDNDADRDAYLWYRSLLLEIRDRGPESALEVLDDPKRSIVLRATALRALADSRAPVATERIPVLCAEMPKKGEEQALFIGAMGRALLSQKGALGNDDFDRAAMAYAQLLDPENKLEEIAALTIARYLGDTLGVDQLYLESGPWLQKIKAKSAAAELGGGASASHTVTGPSFFGLEATGKRVVYVIDMSNSMCKPIDVAIKPRGPVTGGKEKKKKKGDLPTVDDIPWNKVNNRFDLAREHLKISLQRLDKEKEFAVIWFGTEAHLMESTPGMTKASKGAVTKVVKELDSIFPGPATTDAPDGELRGATNLHGGIRRAFQVRSRGIAENEEYIDTKALLEGADTIFVLSDGDPTWDDWDMHDKNYGEDNVVHDVESKVAAPDTERLHYHGPYVMRTNLLDDIERLTLFRDVEIHCIGIGEADMRLLEDIARIGLGGKAHRVGD